MIGFTKSLALEVAKDNVLVNAIAPGPIETPLVGGISADWKRAKAAELPLGRFGLADEVAPTAVLLAASRVATCLSARHSALTPAMSCHE